MEAEACKDNEVATRKNIEAAAMLRSAAREIASLRAQIQRDKAEAWDVHSEVVRRLIPGGGCVGLDIMGQIGSLVEKLDPVL